MLIILARRRARRAFVAGQPPPSMMLTGPRQGRFGWGNNISNQEQYHQSQQHNQFGVSFEPNVGD
jgi:hypothetical protein